MSCSVCENIAKDSEIYWEDDEFSDIPKKENIHFFLSTGDRYYDPCIEYCPYCGAKLKVTKKILKEAKDNHEI